MVASKHNRVFMAQQRNSIAAGAHVTAMHAKNDQKERKRSRSSSLLSS